MAELIVAVARRDAPGAEVRWDRFRVAAWPGATVIDLLNLIAETPVTCDGVTVAPVAWDCNCLEEVCGACAMRVNGVPMLGCSAFALQLAKGGELRLEPLAAFPVMRDLMVDRSLMREQMARFGIGERTPLPPSDVGGLYPLSRCAACGCCLDACPNVGGRGGFVGAFALGQLRMNGVTEAARAALRRRGGPANCSGFGLCAARCPKGIDLRTTIAAINRAARKRRIAR